MSNAVEKIVDTYVQLNDSHALGDLRRYRQKLVVLLKAQTGLNFSLLIGQIDAEIAMIDAGLDRLMHDTRMSSTPSHFAGDCCNGNRDKWVMFSKNSLAGTFSNGWPRTDDYRSKFV